MRIGKYTTVGNYHAEIIGEDKLCPNFSLKGYILAGKKRLLETYWSPDGRNVEKSKWDLR